MDIFSALSNHLDGELVWSSDNFKPFCIGQNKFGYVTSLLAICTKHKMVQEALLHPVARPYETRDLQSLCSGSK